MISFSVTVKDTASPRTAAIAAAYKRGAHLKIMAHAGANVVKSHFGELDKQRHRGTTKFHFYAKAAQATHDQVRTGQSVVSIDHEGIALRRFGGTVRPRMGKYLTIPVDPMAHGRRVREFGNSIQWIINRRTGKGVVTLGGRVIYALTTESTHQPDPAVLPTDSKIADQVADDLRAWTELQGDR